MKLNIVTIDGPSASGKGSLSKNIAKHLDFNILDNDKLKFQEKIQPSLFN